MTPPVITPVLIVGGGPVGMNLALNLAYWNTPCLLVNDQPATANHPQGNSHNARTMEHYRRLGLAEEIRAVGLPPDHCGDAICVTRINGHEMGRIVLEMQDARLSLGIALRLGRCTRFAPARAFSLAEVIARCWVAGDAEQVARTRRRDGSGYRLPPRCPVAPGVR